MKDHAMRRAMPHRDDGATFIGAASRSLFRERDAAAAPTYAAVRLSLSGIRENRLNCHRCRSLRTKSAKKARLTRRVLPKLLAMLRCGL
ncbi:hypothetical protein [Rhodopseudomonas sp. RCAM05734]|uniref:hypothetical protein n=1 Tax=Rhodopseudomonas sp. RCAM05734 TaxID=3457549 RepID=UPI0040445E6E